MNQIKAEAGQQFKSLFIRPLMERKGQISTVIFGSMIVSLSQASIIFIFGPVFKALFAVGETKSVNLSDVLPKSMGDYFSTNFAEVAITQVFIWLPVLLATIALIRGIALYLTNLYQERISLRIADHFRTFSFSRILESSYLKISEKSPAEWMSHIMNDVMFLQQRFSELFKSLIKDGLTVVGAILALAFINWQLTVALFLVSIPSLWILGFAAKKISMYTEIVQRKLALLSAHSADYVARFNEIFVHSGKNRELEYFEKENKELLSNQIRSIALRSSFAPSLELIGFVGFSFFLYLYSNEDSFIKVDPTFLMQFIIALGLCIRPLRNLGEQVSKLQETKGALSQNFSLFLEAAHPVHIDSQGTAKSLPLPFRLESLSISYGKTLALSAHSIELQARDAVVINGASGSGKSTFLKCLAGLIPPSDWNSPMSWSEFSNHCCFVSQTPFLFDGTIRENLTYGLKHLMKSDADIIETAKFLGLDDVLSEKVDLDKTMNSYQTELSGGQKQRLTILRSFLSDKPILLLDEATSALDALTEQKVMQFLIEHYKKRDGIIIFVTHRPVDQNMFNKNWLVEDAKLHL